MKLIYEETRAEPGFLTKVLIDELTRGARLIEQLFDSVYCRKANGTGSIGGHFRHNLDFMHSFLNGIRVGKIDYNRRERDVRTEEDRHYAVERFALAIRRLGSLEPDFLQRKVLIRSELDAEIWHESSVARELEFLHSHTVHHHALIAEKLAFFGVKVTGNFGVAPSTLKFWEQQNALQAA
jgi:hypothetical protein